jgi:hypothetical protein
MKELFKYLIDTDNLKLNLSFKIKAGLDYTKEDLNFGVYLNLDFIDKPWNIPKGLTGGAISLYGLKEFPEDLNVKYICYPTWLRIENKYPQYEDKLISYSEFKRTEYYLKHKKLIDRLELHS